MMRRFLLFCALICAGFTSVWAAAPAAKNDDPVTLSPFVVTEKSRGIIPLNGYFTYSPLSGNVKSPVSITEGMLPGKPLEAYGVIKQERIVAVDGRRLVGMGKSELIRLWMETGEAGDQVKLTIQGVGEDMSVFRQVVVKRIPPPKPAPKAKP